VVPLWAQSICTVDYPGLTPSTQFTIDAASTLLYQPKMGCDSQPEDVMYQGQSFYFYYYGTGGNPNSCCFGQDEKSGEQGWVCCNVLAWQSKMNNNSIAHQININKIEKVTEKALPLAPPAPTWPSSFTAMVARITKQGNSFGTWLYDTTQNAEIFTYIDRRVEEAIINLYNESLQVSYMYNPLNSSYFGCNQTSLNGSLYTPDFTNAKYIERVSIRGMLANKWALADGTMYYDNAATALPVLIQTPEMSMDFDSIDRGEILPLLAPKDCTF